LVPHLAVDRNKGRKPYLGFPKVSCAKRSASRLSIAVVVFVPGGTPVIGVWPLAKPVAGKLGWSVDVCGHAGTFCRS
jgi:hypothetical protein